MRGSGNGVIAHNSLVKDNAHLEGEAEIRGIELSRDMRIGYGVWERPPRYLHIDNDIANIGITESTDGHAYISCQRKPMAKWIKKRTLWQKVGGWTDEMTEQIHRTFEEWLDCPV